jgi:hypothetical protein
MRARSSYYDEPVPESEEDLLLMRLLDEQYTRTPYYGKRKMVVYLQTQGYTVDRKPSEAVDAIDGAGTHVSETPSEPSRGAKCPLSLFIAWSGC